MTITYFITVVNNIKFVSISSLVPNEAPVILELNSPTSTTIHLKWSEVTQLNSVPLLGYVIIFKENITRFQPEIQKICATLAAEDGVGGFENVHILHHKSVCFYEEWKRNTE